MAAVISRYGANVTVAVIVVGCGTPLIRAGRYSHFITQSMAA